MLTDSFLGLDTGFVPGLQIIILDWLYNGGLGQFMEIGF